MFPELLVGARDASGPRHSRGLSNTHRLTPVKRNGHIQSWGTIYRDRWPFLPVSFGRMVRGSEVSVTSPVRWLLLPAALRLCRGYRGGEGGEEHVKTIIFSTF